MKKIVLITIVSSLLVMLCPANTCLAQQRTKNVADIRVLYLGGSSDWNNESMGMAPKFSNPKDYVGVVFELQKNYRIAEKNTFS